MTIDTQKIIEIDRQNVFHASTHLKQHAHGESPARIITGAQGIRIQDSLGNEFIDGFAGLYCVNIGYGRTEMAEAIYEQAKQLAYYHTYVGHTTEGMATLSERIVKLAGQGMSKVYYGMSGSDANETQLKLVWYYNNILGRAPEVAGFSFCTFAAAPSSPSIVIPEPAISEAKVGAPSTPKPTRLYSPLVHEGL